jgi:peroxiredoxin
MGSMRSSLLACVFAVACVGAAAQAVPNAMPNAMLVGKTMQPATVDLAQLKGKVVLLFFWSTDCAVCLDKLPELRRNLEGWRGKDFVIVAVSQDRSRPTSRCSTRLRRRTRR